jgi:hypothetical protein
VPAEVDLFLVLFPDMVKPVLFMKEKLAAGATFEDPSLVRIPGMRYQVVVRLEPFTAVLTLVLLVAE